MILNQDNSFKNFYLPTDNSKFFIFSLDTASEIFDFSKAFNTYAFDFYVIFYKSDTPTINEVLGQKLSNTSSSRAVIWIDDLDNSPINECPFIFIDWNSKKIEYQFFFGNDDRGSRIFIEGDSKVSISFNASSNLIEFDLLKNNRLIENSNGIETINEFNKFAIPIQHQTTLFDFPSKATDNNIGSFCFKTLKKDSNSLQPKTALITPNAQNKNVLFSYQYFDEKSFSQGVDILALIHPCLHQNFNNSSEKFQSYLELFVIDDVKTNFIDEFGNNFTISKGDSLITKITFVNPNKSTINKRSFFFTPKHGENLKFKSSKSNFLLQGNSGTERQDKTKLVFTEFKDILLTEKEDGSVISENYADSITSILISETQDLNYYMDSEKAPRFDNENSAYSLIENAGREVDYKSIKIGTITKDKLIPTIPTLSFLGNPHLEELEKVLIKKRLKNGNSLNGSKAITPQGFLRDFKKKEVKINGLLEEITAPFLDYTIVKDNSKKPPKRDPDVEPDPDAFPYQPKLRFRIDDINLDFDLSISKEDVFFVTTPKLLKQASFKDNFDIFFSICGFDVNLVLKYLKTESQINDKEKIIIFKYSRYNFDELLEDTSKWSNYGDFRKADLKEIKDNIKAEFDLFEKKYNGGKNPDYEYIDKTIRRDRNWNGVVILNIPITNGEELPPLFTGLAASQTLQKDESSSDKLKLETPLKFHYVAFPVNKTFINKDGLIDIKSTSFYGLIDYDIVEINGEGEDYNAVRSFFDEDKLKFVLSKLLVRFENSEIRNFKSFAFVKTPELFEDNVKFDGIRLTNGENAENDSAERIRQLFRLKGNYQKNSAGNDVFIFDIEGSVEILFNTQILDKIVLTKAAFSYTNNKENDYRFDLDGDVFFNKDFGKFKDLIKFDSLSFKNIGLKFPFEKLKLPKISFDVSNLLVLPKIDFNGEGFFSSFPIKFKCFQAFEIKSDLTIPNFDFLNIPVPGLSLKAPGSLWSLVFDFDLGTLGDMELLKKLKGELLFGWSMEGGFKLGLKLNGPSKDGLHIDLFGALKLDIERVDLCSFKNKNSQTYFLRLINARLTVFGKELPSRDDFDFNGIIYARPGDKIAWFIAATKKGPESPENDELHSLSVPTETLVLGVGQRVGPTELQDDRTVEAVISRIKDVFNVDLDPCKSNGGPVQKFYNPERNWLVASEDFIPEEWREIFNLKFVFNDPVLYGIYIQIVGLFEIDILYKKLSDNLGVYSAELQLDPAIRNIDMGGGALTLPNIGLDVYTNGDFKVDVGYPRTSSDWSRSALFQLRPYVGWAGFYFTKLRTASISLFSQYENELPEKGKGVNIIQAGFAFRIGIGAYIDKGIFYVGASISLYGILEGALAFNKNQGKLDQFFPDHFALRGRVGAIAELVGYVDFKIIKASVYVILRIEFGMLLVIINGKLKPVPLYIEGEVSVQIRVRITCFRVFRSRVCIYITFRFKTTVRFNYTLGDDSSKKFTLDNYESKLLNTGPIIIALGAIPIIYIPSVTKTTEGGIEKKYLVHQFAINFFGHKFEGDGNDKKLVFHEGNILVENIIKPIFKGIFDHSQGTSITYNNLRKVFLEGMEGSNAEFNLDSFNPTLNVGYNETDINFFESTYGLKGEDLEDFLKYIKDDPCGNDKPCPFRTIPIPIGSKITVKSKEDGSFSSDKSGFRIKLDGIFKSSTGEDSIIRELKQEKLYSDESISKIDKHFDAYMSQFIERPKGSTSGLLQELHDIKEKLIIPEYFKLIGLLTLESYYNFLNATDEYKLTNDNPDITMENIFSKLTGWDLNKNLEEIIGQLNYFYNNGLRLPDDKNSPKAYYELLKQVDVIQKINTNVTPANADIIFSKNDGSSPISLKDDMFRDKEGKYAALDAFVMSADETLSVKLSEIEKGIVKIDSDAPYQLTDVKLPVPNSRIRSEDLNSGFFEIPKKISQNFKQNKDDLEYPQSNLKLFVVNNQERNDIQSVSIDYIPCFNVEVSVKPHRINGKVKSLELINVFIDDLNMIHKIKAIPDFAIVQNISIYLKTGDSDKTIYKLLVHKGKEENTLLIKTNLSPRTHPPVIDNTSPIGFTSEGDNFVAKLTEKKKFTQILWEGVTTNNGGYFLFEGDSENLFNEKISKLSEEQLKDIKIIFSFESYENKPFYSFSNYIKVNRNTVAGRDVFDELDKNSHSLYGNLMDQNGVKIKEYHPSIPAHCFSFTIERELPKQGYEHYIPIEFEIAGDSIITKEKVLPLMPTQKKTDENSEDYIDDKLFYSHISPLSKVNSIENIERYINIGKTINVEFGVRDSYGFRAVALNKSLKYKHRYFDKLIPINAWPFISISYWFEKYVDADTLQFKLSVKGLENPDLSGYGDLKDVRTTLNTIIAQLSDSRTAVSFNYKIIPTVKLNEVLKEFVTEVRDNIDKLSYGPIKKEFVFTVNPDSALINILNPQILIERKPKTGEEIKDIFFELDSKIWDKDSIRRTKASVNLYNPVKVEIIDANGNKVPTPSELKTLNESITNNGKFTLGITSKENEKVMYLINKQYLIFSTTETSPLDKSGYFAIKPYSNMLWSGIYQRKNPQTNLTLDEQKFSNIDLDKGLNQILSTIDDFLLPSIMKELSSSSTESLIASKKLLAKSELMSKTGNIDVKDENLNADQKEGQAKLRKDFENLILAKLDYFYQYDGAINLTPKIAEVTLDKLKGYRLSISLDKQDDYNLQSSKIQFIEGQKPNWFIFFDQRGVSDYIELELIPTLTHIECDIQTIGAEIEMSTWIQLIQPHEILPKGTKLNTKHTDKDKKWPRIFRGFPPKPQIEKHEAVQTIQDDSPQSKTWSDNLGEWQYKIAIKDEIKAKYDESDGFYIYIPEDELKIAIKTKLYKDVSAFAEYRNFKGFIAYWSSKDIYKFKEEFITDLSFQLSLNPPSDKSEFAPSEDDNYFITLRKTKDSWIKEENNTPFDVNIKSELQDKILNIIISGKGFNLLKDEKGKIKSVTSEVIAYRNKLAKNDDFVYVTEMVSPATWATPHINFYTAIKIENGDMQNVFNKMGKLELPYKSNAKLLVNTSDLDEYRKAKLPVIPITQMEFRKGVLPSQNPFDNIFEGKYKNGYPSISITIYNDNDVDSSDDNNLPIFFVNNIYKQKQ